MAEPPHDAVAHASGQFSQITTVIFYVMAIKRIRISSIFGGRAPAGFFSSKDQFLSSLGIDPDFPIDDSDSDNDSDTDSSSHTDDVSDVASDIVHSDSDQVEDTKNGIGKI